ncbi:MAG TPA: sigma-70 family RNA polymerase sigma factor [Thermoanaerobaculia bacterium]|nr:sigma-70 family RNA polymerase sigma factor [Thermoanaerobaculia bacterium]
MEQATDAELMRRVRDGDHGAFASLVDRYKDGLVNYLTHLRGERDRADDLAQEAFLRLYQSAARYDERERLAPYLYRIATNLVRSEFRRLRRWRQLLPWLEASSGRTVEAPSRGLLEREAGVQVRAALEALPMRYRAPLVLREIEGWSYHEIATALDCREGTIKSRIARGRNRLRELLAPYWNGGTDESRIRAASSLVAERNGV